MSKLDINYNTKICLAVKELEYLTKKLEKFKKTIPPRELVSHLSSVLNYLDSINFKIDRECRTSSGHPLICLLLEIDRRIEFIRAVLGKMDDSSESHSSLCYDLLLFINCLLQDKSYRERAENIARSERKRTSSLLRYIIHLKSKCSKLMVIRLDFSYSQECLLQEAFNPQRMIESHWSQLLGHVKEQFPSFLGYVAKFEYAAKTGSHIHVIFLMNGSMVRCDSTIGKLLGEYWNTHVTSGMGRYFNCNSPAHIRRLQMIEKPIAVGSFTGKEPGFTSLMKEGLRYLAKDDSCMAIVMPDIKKTFRRGLIA